MKPHVKDVSNVGPSRRPGGLKGKKVTIHGLGMQAPLCYGSTLPARMGAVKNCGSVGIDHFGLLV